MAFTLPDSISAEQLLDQQADLLLLADLQGGLKFANRAALQFWGGEADRLKEKGVWQLLQSTDFDARQLMTLTRRLGHDDQLRLLLTAQQNSSAQLTVMDSRIRSLVNDQEPLLLISCRPAPLGLSEVELPQTSAPQKQPSKPDTADRLAADVLAGGSTANTTTVVATDAGPAASQAADFQEYSLRIDERGAILDASANFPPLVGVDNLNTLRECSLRKFLEDYTWQRLQQVMHSADGHCEDLELELRGLSGESRMFSFSGEIWRHEGGWPGGMVGTLRDTSRRRRWDDDLADSEARYRALFNQGNDPVLVFRDQQIIDFNQQALEVFGATPNQLASKSVEALSPALQPGQLQSSELIRQKFDAVTAGEALRFEWRGRRFDGVPIDLEVSLSLVDLAGKPCVQGIMRDVTEQLAVRAALQRSEQMYNTIVNNSGDGIVVIDLDRKVVFSNQRFQQLTGADESAVLGHDYLEFLDDGDGESAIELFSRSFATGEPLHAEFWVSIRPESQIRVEVNALLTEHENMPAMIAFVRDITEQYQADQALREHRDNLAEQVTMKTLSLTLALDQAEAANRAKSRFLANMSHELRTPLHSVLSFAEIGESRAADDGSDQLLGYFNRIQTSGKRLLELLNDLLDLTQLESGGIEYHQEWCDLSQLVGKSLDDMQVEIGARQVSVKVVPGDASVRAWCDFERVAQVVTNLVSNALKFSDPDSPVSVTLSCNAQQQAMIMVEDKGVGLPEDSTDRLFDPFVESERTRTEAGGTGLGLAICKQIVDAHGGTIGGFNKNGGGASFYFTLPADQAVDSPTETDD